LGAFHRLRHERAPEGASAHLSRTDVRHTARHRCLRASDKLRAGATDFADIRRPADLIGADAHGTRAHRGNLIFKRGWPRIGKLRCRLIGQHAPEPTKLPHISIADLCYLRGERIDVACGKVGLLLRQRSKA